MVEVNPFSNALQTIDSKALRENSSEACIKVLILWQICAKGLNAVFWLATLPVFIRSGFQIPAGPGLVAFG
jgi:hypothetical protein